MLLYVHSSIAIILMGKRELVALLILSSWCLVMVERLFLAVPQGFLQFVIVVFPDHTHLLFLYSNIVECLPVNPATCVRLPAGTCWKIFRSTTMALTVNTPPLTPAVIPRVLLEMILCGLN